MPTKFPMTRQQYDENLVKINDPEAIGDMTLPELQELRDEMVRFQESRQDVRNRLREQGLNSDQIDQVEQAQDASTVDPNAPISPETLSRKDDAVLAGVGEGAKQSVEGMFDIAMDFSVDVVGRMLPEDLAGALQLSEDDRQEWKASVAERRTKDRVKQVEQFGRLPGEISELVGQVSPWMLAKQTAAGFMGLIARQGFLGGTAAVSHVQPSDAKLFDRWREAAFGTTIGVATGGILGVPGLLRKRASEGLVKAFNAADPRQREIVEQMVQKMTGDKDFVFSAAELTGNRFYLGIEISAADTASLAARSARLDTLYTHLFKRAKELSGKGLTPGAIAAEMQGTLKTFKDSVYKQATGSWGRSAESIITAHGDDAVFRGTEYLAKIDSMIAEQSNALTSMGAKPSPALLKYRDEVAGIVEAGGPNSEQTLDILKGLNNLIGGKTQVFETAAAGTNENLGRALMGAFTSELEGAATSPGAIQAIKLLRQGYRQDMAAAEAIKRSTFNAVFGNADLPQNPGAAIDRVMKMEPGDQRAMAQFLKEWNPELYNGMQRSFLKRTLLKSQAKPGDADVVGDISMARFAENLADVFGRQGKVGSGFFEPALQKEIETTASALRILANKATRTDIGGTKPEEWTINLISRSPEFFGRFVTRLMASGETLETALLNPHWRHALRTIATEPLGTTKMKAANLFLVQWMGENEAAKAFQEQQQQHMQESQDFANEALRRGDSVL